MDNVNNLNGVPNFGHGEEAEHLIPTVEEPSAIDDTDMSPETETSEKKVHRAKARSAAVKALGGKY